MSRQLSRLFEDFLGESRKHVERTGQMSFDCPACGIDGEGKGNLEVNYQKGVFKCWVCKETHKMKGGIPWLIKRYGDSRALKEYKRYKPEDFEYDITGNFQIDIKLPEGFKLLSKCSSKDYKYDEVIKYLKGRGITEKMIKRFNIGYCLSGEYFNRVIIPSYDEAGDLNYFIARAFDEKVWPKYKNLPTEVVAKTDIIFNEKFLNYDSTIYLVEGVFDHLVIPNSIPLLGKFLPNDFKLMLLERAKANIVVVLDGEDEAIDDAIRIYKDLNTGKLYNKVRLCVPSLDYDPSKVFELFGYKGIFNLLRSAYHVKESDIY
jgi:DNA primase